MTYREAYEEVTRVWLALRESQGTSTPGNYPEPESKSLEDDLESGFPDLLDLLWKRLTDEELDQVDPHGAPHG